MRIGFVIARGEDKPSRTTCVRVRRSANNSNGVHCTPMASCTARELTFNHNNQSIIHSQFRGRRATSWNHEAQEGHERSDQERRDTKGEVRQTRSAPCGRFGPRATSHEPRATDHQSLRRFNGFHRFAWILTVWTATPSKGTSQVFLCPHPGGLL